MRSPGAVQCVALAERCTAEPGSRLIVARRNRGPGSAKQRFAKSYALHRARDTRSKTKTGPKAPLKSRQKPRSLLDLGFLEFDMLARDRVVLLLDQLVGHGARILLGDVIEAGVCGGDELDLDGDRFGHG